MPLDTVARTRVLPIAATLTAALLGTAPVRAEEPSLHGTLTLELQDDATLASDDEGAEINNLAATVEAGLALSFTETLAIRSDLVAESITDPEPFEDRVVEDMGAYVETLYLEYATERLQLYAGKINPPFGVAWDIAPGLYGTDFAEDYELTERLGFGGSVVVAPPSWGAPRLGVAAFFADTTALARSLFEERGGLDRDDGGPSNTGDPASFAVTLDGAIPMVPDYAYHAAFSRQAPGRGDIDHEVGVALALYGSTPLAHGVTVSPVAELVVQENDEAGADDVSYLTLGAAFAIERWTVSVGGTLRAIDVAGGADLDDTLAQIGVAYDVGYGFAVEIRYKTVEEAGIDSDVVGGLVSYEVEF
jgi:hypothetical protein